MPFAGLQESVVHETPSSHMTGIIPTHTPPLHRSVWVHALESLQAPPWFVGVVAQPPSTALQESAVHEFPSSQVTGWPAQNTPPSTSGAQKSFEVHACPSLQLIDIAAGVLVQPEAPQVSTVQGLPSSQVTGVPVHPMPPSGSIEQVSDVVHVLPSLQLAPARGMNMQAIVIVSQPSLVHGLLSLHMVPPVA